MCGHVEPNAEVVPKEQTRLFVVLHMVEFGDATVQIILRHIGLQRDIRALKNFQRLLLKPQQTSKQLIQLCIDPANGNYQIEPDVKGPRCRRSPTSDKALQKLLNEPDEYAQGVRMFHLRRFVGH